MKQKNGRHSAKQIYQSTKIGGTHLERSMVRTTQITSYLFHAPEHYVSAALIFIFSLFIGLVINFDTSNFLGNFSINNLYDKSVIFGLVIIGFPALISGLISTPLAELTGGLFNYKRSFLLALLSCGILFIVLVCGKILRLVFSFNFLIIYIFGYALIFSVRHSVLLAISNPKHLNSIFVSINHTALGFIFLWVIPETGLTITYQEISYMFWFTLIFFITTLLWLQIITTPFRRAFGVNGLLLMKQALTQFSKDYKSGQILENEFFAKIGSKTNLRVGVVCFKNQNNKYNPGKASPTIQTLMVIPSIHPGPFGKLGGSNLPKKLSRYLANTSSNLMVFHGPAAHAENPVATRECRKIARTIQRLVNHTKYSGTATHFIRAIKGTTKDNLNYSTAQSNLTLCGQRLGNGVLYIHTSAPEPTDDIDNPTGESIVIKGELETNSKALFIDAHNCLEPGTGKVFFNSKKARNMLGLVSKVNKELNNAEKLKLKTGYANDQSYTLTEGLGPMGIQVLIISCELPEDKSQAKEYAYILLDGNNMISGLREQILGAIDGLVDDAEVFTTDNHIVNATMGGYNPVGLKVNPDRITAKIKYLVKKAKSNLEPSEVGMNSGMVKGIQVLGKYTPMRLSTTINSTIGIMKNSLVTCQALALTLCWLVVIF